MNTVGIITIHKIYNYGSVLQAYALQRVCEDLGYCTEIIDYQFPNQFHLKNPYSISQDTQPSEPFFIKLLFTKDIVWQHKRISKFVSKYQHLSKVCYKSPDELRENSPQYDIYITGSDQVWNPRYCNGDPSFLLHFAPDNKRKISYAASIGTDNIPEDLKSLFSGLLGRYQHIAIRENSGRELIKELTGKEAEVVLDPTLLLNREEWNKIATPRRLVKKKYILCYFLNYSFNAFPYVDDLANYIQSQTGYEIVRVARPPHRLLVPHTHYRVGSRPEDFLALIRDAEMVLTTSFHGTAFAVNYGKPVFSIVKDKSDIDSRQINLMHYLGLDNQVVSIRDEFPDVDQAYYNIQGKQKRLEDLRNASKRFLKNSLSNE